MFVLAGTLAIEVSRAPSNAAECLIVTDKPPSITLASDDASLLLDPTATNFSLHFLCDTNLDHDRFLIFRDNVSRLKR